MKVDLNNLDATNTEITFALIKGKIDKIFKEANIKLDQCEQNLKAIAACQTLEELEAIRNPIKCVDGLPVHNSQA